MKKSTFKYWICLSLCFLLLICSIIYYITNNKTTTSNHSVTLTNIGFDTSITFSADCSQSDFDQYVSLLEEKYTYYNQLFDQYNEYEGVNNVYTLNHEAYNHPVEVDAELIDCIQIAFKVNDLSSSFDVTQGDLLSVWHTYRTEGIELNDNGKDGNLPTDQELQEAMQHGGKDKVIISDNTISYTDENMSIDLGGIGKGYATQKVKEALVEAGCTTGFINAGGNVVLIGSKIDGSNWNIGIQDPDTNDALVDFSTPTEKCIVTSGDYQRYYTVNGKRYSHIIDIHTGYPANYMRSVTIICNDSAKADALSTTLFTLSYEDGLKLIESLQEEMDIEAIWIMDKGTTNNPDYSTDSYDIYVTKGIKDEVKIKEN